MSPDTIRHSRAALAFERLSILQTLRVPKLPDEQKARLQQRLAQVTQAAHELEREELTVAEKVARLEALIARVRAA